MPTVFERQLALEGVERRLLFIAREVNEAPQPVQRNGTEP